MFATRAIDGFRTKSEAEWNILEATASIYYLFPNIQLALTSGNVSLVQMYPDPAHPDDPSRSRTRILHYFSQEMIDQASAERGESVVVTAENTYENFADPGATITPSAVAEIFNSTVDQEDFVMGEHQQRSAESGQVESLMFGRNEPALHHYHTHFREALGLAPLERIEG